MKEKFKEIAARLHESEWRREDQEFMIAHFDRLASLPDEAPNARETIITGDGLHRFVVDVEYANYYRDSFFAALAKIAELEKQLAELANSTLDTLNTHPETSCCSITRARAEAAIKGEQS